MRKHLVISGGIRMTNLDTSLKYATQQDTRLEENQQ